MNINHVKRWLTSLVNRKLQIKRNTKMPLHTHWDGYNQKTVSGTLARMWRNWSPCTLSMKRQNGATTGKTVWQFPKRLNMWSSKSNYNDIPKKNKTYVHIKTWTWMFIAVFLTIPRRGTNPKVQQMMNRFNSMHSLHTIKCCTAINRNQVPVIHIKTAVPWTHYAS